MTACLACNTRTSGLPQPCPGPVPARRRPVGAAPLLVRRGARRRRVPQLAQHPHARAAAERDAAGHQLRPGHVVRPRNQTWDLVVRAAAEQLRDPLPDGAAAAQPVYAKSPTSLVPTDDSSCSWKSSAGGAVDAFVDPTNPNRVLAVVDKRGDAGSTLYRHGVGGRRHHLPQAPLHSGGRGPHHGRRDRPLGPQTVYLTLTSGPRTCLRSR